MPKPIARSKTRKAVAKRFKITARGKVLRAHSSRRHLLSTKSAKRKRHLSKAARVDSTDVARIKANLPFAYESSGSFGEATNLLAAYARWRSDFVASSRCCRCV